MVDITAARVEAMKEAKAEIATTRAEVEKAAEEEFGAGFF